MRSNSDDDIQNGKNQDDSKMWIGKNQDRDKIWNFIPIFVALVSNVQPDNWSKINTTNYQVERKSG